MARKGRDLEILVEHLERLLADGRGITVESPKYIPDKVTGERREHDVVLTYPGHHQIVVAIDCKDWTAAVDSPAIEAFVTKCRDTEIQRGIIVARGSFTEPALEKAKAHNISCLSLSEALTFAWLEAPGIRFSRRNVTAIRFKALVDPGKLPEDVTGKSLALMEPDGTVVSNDTLSAQVHAAIESVWQTAPEAGTGVRTAVFAFRLPNPMKLLIDGKVVPVAVLGAEVTVDYVLEDHFFPFKLLEYGEARGGVISQSAQADVEFAGWKGTVTILQKPGEGATLYLTHREGNLPQSMRFGIEHASMTDGDQATTTGINLP